MPSGASSKSCDMLSRGSNAQNLRHQLISVHFLSRTWWEMQSLERLFQMYTWTLLIKYISFLILKKAYFYSILLFRLIIPWSCGSRSRNGRKYWLENFFDSRTIKRILPKKNPMAWPQKLQTDCHETFSFDSIDKAQPSTATSWVADNVMKATNTKVRSMISLNWIVLYLKWLSKLECLFMLPVLVWPLSSKVWTFSANENRNIAIINWTGKSHVFRRPIFLK